MKRAFVVFTVLIVAALVSVTALARIRVIGSLAGSAAASEYNTKVRMRGFKPNELCVHSIGQSHIDAAWKWRKAQTMVKVYNTWSQAIDHMERHPEFIFSGSAPQYYEWILEQHPDVFAKIVEREKEGRWEIVGGQWVEPDGNIPDGESFVRQRLMGQRFYLEHFGHLSTVSWMLDSFGYNRNMPQIMARSGAKYMWTSKLTWNDTTMFPFHNFWWRGPDGSQVLTHICPIVPLPVYFPYSELRKYKQTRYLLEPGMKLVADYSTLPGTIRDALSDDWVNEIGAFYGLGDGGLGPREIEVRIQEALAKKGYARASTGLELFQHIEQYSDRMPVWDDEMYLEFHRGVQTTQAWIKRANRKGEQMFRTAETLRSFLHVLGVEYPRQVLNRVWKLFLLQHFHDILPGSSIPEVYEDAREDFELIDSSLASVTAAGMTGLARMVDTRPPREGLKPVVVFNPLTWERDGLIIVDLPEGQSFRALDRRMRPLDQEEIEKEDGKRQLLLRAVDVPSAGYKVFFLEPTESASAAEGGPSVTDTGDKIVLENELVRVAVDKTRGLITSLVHKETGTEMISSGSSRLRAFYDRPKVYSAWNINRNYSKREMKIPDASSVEISHQGPMLAEVKVRFQALQQGRLSVFDQRIRLVKGDPVVYIDLDSDFHMHDTLVKLEFNTTVETDTVSADGPYYVIEKPTHPSTKSQKAMWEMICHKWIDLSGPELGLSLLNNGKYGFSLTPDGKGFRLSVIKGARFPRANFEATDVKHQYYTFPIPTGFTDQGAHHAELGLLAHPGGWHEAGLWEAGFNFNTPLEAYWADVHQGQISSSGSLISIEAESVYIGAVKRAYDDNDLVVRLVETAGRPDTAVVSVGEGMRIRSAAETDLLELNPVEVRAGRSTLQVGMEPFQIRTFKLAVESR